MTPAPAQPHDDSPAVLRVIGALDGIVTVDPREYPGFSAEQIEAGLSVPAVEMEGSDERNSPAF